VPRFGILLLIRSERQNCSLDGGANEVDVTRVTYVITPFLWQRRRECEYNLHAVKRRHTLAFKMRRTLTRMDVLVCLVTCTSGCGCRSLNNWGSSHNYTQDCEFSPAPHRMRFTVSLKLSSRYTDVAVAETTRNCARFVTSGPVFRRMPERRRKLGTVGFGPTWFLCACLACSRNDVMKYWSTTNTHKCEDRLMALCVNLRTSCADEITSPPHRANVHSALGIQLLLLLCLAPRIAAACAPLPQPDRMVTRLDGQMTSSFAGPDDGSLEIGRRSVGQRRFDG
jgi:hypothetical protein